MSKLTHHSIPDYLGWSIEWDYGWYRAVGPDYEPDYNSEDGWYNPPNAQVVTERTLWDLHQEIENWYLDQDLPLPTPCPDVVATTILNRWRRAYGVPAPIALLTIIAFTVYVLYTLLPSGAHLP